MTQATQPHRNADKHRYKHGEAFCLMEYESEDRQEREIIWNSRDGVTPFIVSSRSGRAMQHVRWNLDPRAADHKPMPGERIFVDATRDLVLEAARGYVDHSWAREPYPMKNAGLGTKEECVERFVHEWTKPGAPCLVVVQHDGSYRHCWREDLK